MTEQELARRAEELEREKARFRAQKELFESSCGLTDTKIIQRLSAHLGPAISSALGSHLRCVQEARFTAIDSAIMAIVEDRRRADAVRTDEARNVKIALELTQKEARAALEMTQHEVRETLDKSQKAIREDLVGYRKETKEDLAGYRKEIKDDLVEQGNKIDRNLESLFTGRNENAKDIAMLKTQMAETDKYGGVRLTKAALWLAAISAFLALVAIVVSVWQGVENRHAGKKVQYGPSSIMDVPKLSLQCMTAGNTNKKETER